MGLDREAARCPNLIDLRGDLDALVVGYFADYQRAAVEVRRLVAEHRPVPEGAHPDHDGRLFDWLVQMLNYGPPDGPERAWPIILVLVARAPDEGALTYVGCGPIEDLVNKAGARFSDRLLAQVEGDPRFRRAFAHVWFHDDVPDVLRDRILAIRGTDWA